jgi:hypothetical protein
MRALRPGTLTVSEPGSVVADLHGRGAALLALAGCDDDRRCSVSKQLLENGPCKRVDIGSGLRWQHGGRHAAAKSWGSLTLGILWAACQREGGLQLSRRAAPEAT